MRFMRLEDIRFKQGVMHDAAQLHAVIGEDMAIVFQVLPELGHGRVFQPCLQLREHVVARELLGHARIAMRERDVRRHAGLATQGNADQLRRQRIERRGFRIDCRHARGADIHEPGIELRLRRNHFITGRYHRWRVCKQARLRFTGRCRHVRRAGSRFAQPGLETITFIKFNECGIIDGLGHERVHAR